MTLATPFKFPDPGFERLEPLQNGFCSLSRCSLGTWCSRRASGSWPTVPAAWSHRTLFPSSASFSWVASGASWPLKTLRPLLAFLAALSALALETPGSLRAPGPLSPLNTTLSALALLAPRAWGTLSAINAVASGRAHRTNNQLNAF